MIRTLSYGFVYLDDYLHKRTFLNCRIIGRMPLKQRKFGIQLLTTDFNRIAITKEYRERIQPLTHSYQHNLDDHTTNVLFNLGTPEQETVSFFKEQLRILNNG